MDIDAELTASHKVAFYQFTYNKPDKQGITIDAGKFLHEGKVDGVSEARFFAGSEIEIISDHEVRGYNRVRSGWNNAGL